MTFVAIVLAWWTWVFFITAHDKFRREGMGWLKALGVAFLVVLGWPAVFFDLLSEHLKKSEQEGQQE